MKRAIKSYFKGFLRYSTQKFNFLIIFLSAIFVSLGIGLYFFYARVSESAIVEQTLHRQQVIARAGAVSMDSFFELLSAQLVIFSKNPDIVNVGENTQVVLDLFVDRYADSPFSGVILTDGKGLVLFNANRDRRPDVGMDVSDRDYFSWARGAGAGEVFVSNAVISKVGSSKGKFVVVVATPVYENNEFQGVLAAGVVLSELAETYLTPLKFSENTRVYLIGPTGVMLHAPQEKFIGVNYFDYLNANPYPGSDLASKKLTDVLESESERKIDVVLPNERTGELTRFLIATANINLDSNTWTLAVANPINEANLFYAPFYMTEISILLLFVFTVIVFSILVVSIKRATAINVLSKVSDKGGKKN